MRTSTLSIRLRHTIVLLTALLFIAFHEHAGHRAIAATPSPGRQAPTTCSPHYFQGSPCIPFELEQTPHLRLLAADGGLALVSEFVQGEPAALRVISVTTQLVPLGNLSGSHVAGQLVAGYDYAQLVPTQIEVIAIDDGYTPTPVNRVAFDGALLEATKGALFVASSAPTSATAASYLQSWSLADPSQPRLVSELSVPGVRTALARGERLFAATDSDVAIFDIADPTRPLALSAIQVISPSLNGPVEVALHGDVLYFMAQSPSGDQTACHMVDIQHGQAPVVSASCPFLPTRTTFVGDFAYVNPNPGAAQFLDYRIYSIADPSNPVDQGAELLRFSDGIESGGKLLATSPGGALQVLAQDASGRLAVRAQSWTTDDVGRWDKPLLDVGGLLYLDAGAGSHGGRLIRLVQSGALPRLLGEFESPWIGAGSLQQQGNRLYSLYRNRVTLFDARDPSHPEQVGQFVLPAGLIGTRAQPAGGDQLYVVAEGNILLDVDTSQPLTPTLSSQQDLPGESQFVRWTPGALYLLGSDSLLVMDLSGAAPRLHKSVPIEPGVEYLTGYGNAIYVVRTDRVEILDVSRRLDPVIGGSLSYGNGELHKVFPVSNGMLAVLVSSVMTAPALAAGPSLDLLVYDLSSPLQPRLNATLEGLADDDVWFGGARALLPRNVVYRLGSAQRVVRRLPVTLPASLDFAEGIVYTVPAGAFTGDADTTVDNSICLTQSQTAQPIALPPGTSLYAGPFVLSANHCFTGEPVLPALPILVTVTHAASGLAWPNWSQATIATWLPSGWSPISPPASLGMLSAPIGSVAPWAVLGPQPAPRHLPYVQK